MPKSWRSHDRSTLSQRILARWRRPVASVEALNLLDRAMRAVRYWRIAMAIKMASEVKHLLSSSSIEIN
jgi:hypothetical protein